jgi:hypothetical protein
MRRFKNPKAGDYDYEGIPNPICDTFSIGIFQWVPTADGKRIKRGKVIKRIKGYPSDIETAVFNADKYCQELESQVDKSVRG